MAALIAALNRFPRELASCNGWAARGSAIWFSNHVNFIEWAALYAPWELGRPVDGPDLTKLDFAALGDRRSGSKIDNLQVKATAALAAYYRKGFGLEPDAAQAAASLAIRHLLRAALDTSRELIC